MNMQRVLVNQMILDQGQTSESARSGAAATSRCRSMADAARDSALLTTRDVLRYATMNGAKALRLDQKTGSLTPGKEADIIILDATTLNVAPLNQVPGAVVSLMDRTNVETVIVAGKVRKWKGQLLDADLNRLRHQLEKVCATTCSPRPAFRKSVQQPVAHRTHRRQAGLLWLPGLSIGPQDAFLAPLSMCQRCDAAMPGEPLASDIPIFAGR